MEASIPPVILEQGSHLLENGPMMIEWGVRLVSATLVLIAGWMIGNWLSRRIQSIKRLDETLTGFMGGFVRYAVLIIAIVTILGQFGVQTASLLAVLGAAGLAIGLALQGTLSNVAAGVMLLVLRPFKVGDYVSTGGQKGASGTIKALGLFGTEMATAENVFIFVPNSMIWNSEIWNYTRYPHRRQDIRVGISYDDDIARAMKITNSVLLSDPRIVQDDGDKKPEVLVDNMGDFSINLIVRFWSKREDYWELRWDLTKKIRESLDREGLNAPYPTQVAIQRAG